MPRHDHGGRTRGSNVGQLLGSSPSGDGLGRLGEGDPIYIGDHIHEIVPEGEGEVHNKMPPYVTPTYCRKD